LQEAIRINGDDVKQANQELTTTRDPEVKAVESQFQKTESKHLSDAQALLPKM